ncbi:MAG: DNA-3-methyladenine glycosylase family protein, partial [Spirochaetales bacterium]
MMLTERDLSLKETLQSGQTFRCYEQDGLWTVFSGIDENVRVLKISQDNLTPAQEDPFWSNYFDLQTDYNAMKTRFCKVSPVMERACAYAPGIRILRQDSWEALACFVVSQNNNIKRITGIVDRICKRFGKKNEAGENGFPCAKTLADAPLDALRDTGLGFRDSYIKNTACAVLDGKLDFDFLKSASIEEARKAL